MMLLKPRSGIGVDDAKTLTIKARTIKISLKSPWLWRWFMCLQMLALYILFVFELNVCMQILFLFFFLEDFLIKLIEVDCA